MQDECSNDSACARFYSHIKNGAYACVRNVAKRIKQCAHIQDECVEDADCQQKRMYECGERHHGIRRCR